MAIYFSKELGFQHEEDGAVIPESAKNISESAFRELFRKQGDGLVIVQGIDGLPIAVEPGPTPVHYWDGSEWGADEGELLDYLIASAESKRKYLMSVAAENIFPLQDAVDMEEATEGEINSLKAWKLYRVELSRLDQKEGWPSDIRWPKSPS